MDQNNSNPEDLRILKETNLSRKDDQPTAIEEKEFWRIKLRRFKNHAGVDPPTDTEQLTAVFGPEPTGQTADPKDGPTQADPQHERDLVGLAISGGGIRSATFGLGILQGLADHNLLKYVDYLSTVSGGGFIGSWFTAWVKREGSLENVVQQLKPARTEQAAAARGFACDQNSLEKNNVRSAEPEPIHHLRQYSNYLSPRLSFFSSDTWSLVAVYVRNLVSNLLAFLPAILFIFLAVRLAAWLYAMEGAPNNVILALTAVALILTLIPFVMITLTLNGLTKREDRKQPNATLSGWYFMVVRVGLVVGTLLWTWLLIPPVNDSTTRAVTSNDTAQVSVDSSSQAELDFQDSSTKARHKWLSTFFSREKFVWMDLFKIAIIFCVLHGFAALFRECTSWGSLEPSPIAFNYWWPSVCGAISGFAGGAILYLFLNQLLWTWSSGLVLTFGPPLLMICVVIAAIVEVALLGTLADETEREWWNQLVAWLLIISITWSLICSIALFAPLGLSMLNSYLATGVWTTWAVTAAGGLWAARSSQTTGKGVGWKEVASAIAPYVFLIGLLCLMSWFACFLLTVNDEIIQNQTKGFLQKTKEVAQPLEVVYESTLNGDSWQHRQVHKTQTVIYADSWNALVAKSNYVIQNPPMIRLSILIVGSIVLTVIMSFRVDVNEFSLNAMYANRLTRCYLGASRRKARKPRTYRKPDKANKANKADENFEMVWGAASATPSHSQGPLWFPNRVTGFDPQDDMPLSFLNIGEADDSTEANPKYPVENLKQIPYWGPMPIINTAMNLVAGDELAWQERKAESFTLSPLYCGTESLGYCPTKEFAGGLTLGRAVAISGAAASPNMGSHSAPATAAMMTLFNVRLGWWLPNPTEKSWKECRPWFFLKWLAIELFSQTNSSRKYLNISDGGHFENLGVFELIRRRCRCIIVSDAGADPNYEFEDLAGLIRKCRTDFGIDIEIDASGLKPDMSTGKSPKHFAVGTIRYDQVEPTSDVGILVYIKPSLTGHEPSDVTHYAERHPSFPQQSTVDQFFSESQFEAYRLLGFHIAKEVFREVGLIFKDCDASSVNCVTDTEKTNVNVTNRQHFFVVNFIRLMQKEWISKPKNLDDQLVDAVETYVQFHKDIRRDPLLAHLTRDLYPESRGSIGRKDLHSAIQMLQIMENAWLKMNLNVNHADPLNAGWVNMMRRWSQSKVFRRHWHLLRHEYSREFVKFCEDELSVKCPMKIVPLSTTGALNSLYAEFELDWPSECQKGIDRSLKSMVDRAYQYTRQKQRKTALWGIEVHSLEDPDSSTIAGVMGLCPLLEPQLPLIANGEKNTNISNYTLAASQFKELAELRKETTPEATLRIEELEKELETAHCAFELFVWIRPCYRGHGIGRQLLEHVMFKEFFVDDRSGLFNDLSNKPRPLVAVLYPKSRWTGKGDKLAKQLWFNVFSFYDFRRPKLQQNWPQAEKYEILISNCHWRD